MLLEFKVCNNFTEIIFSLTKVTLLQRMLPCLPEIAQVMSKRISYLTPNMGESLSSNLNSKFKRLLTLLLKIEHLYEVLTNYNHKHNIVERRVWNFKDCHHKQLGIIISI